MTGTTNPSTDGPPTTKKKHSNALLFAIIGAVILGTIGGLAFPADRTPGGDPIAGTGITSIAFLGDLFLALLFMIVVPLVMTSIINGISSLGDVRKIGRIGGVTVLYYFTTTFLAVVTGIALAIIVQPGVSDDQPSFLRPTADSPDELGEVDSSSLPEANQITVQPGEMVIRAVNAPKFVQALKVQFGGDTESIEIAGRRRSAPAAIDFQGPRVKAVFVAAPPSGNGQPTSAPQTQPQTQPISSPESDGGDGSASESDVPADPVPAREGSRPLVLDFGADDQEIDLETGTYYLAIQNKGSEPSTIFAQMAYTVEEKGSYTAADIGLGERILAFLEDFTHRIVPRNLFASMAEANILPLIFFALFLGAILTTMGPQGTLVIDFTNALFEAMMRMVHVIMWFAPVGIFAIVASKIGGTPDLMAELGKLGAYVGTVIGGLAIHGVITLPLILWLFTGRSPIRYAYGMGRALLTAFSTASSSATMPVTMEALQQDNKVSKKSVEFVTPLGATINMDGTALYEAVAVIFMAQLMGIPLTEVQYVIIFITATLAAIGAAGIPEAGLVTMTMVLLAVGLPLDAVGYILAIDWFLDRIRTTVNVWGDASGAAIVDVHALGAKRGDPTDDGDVPATADPTPAASPA